MIVLRRTAASEMVGAILIAMITIAMSVAYAIAGRSAAEGQTLSMVDLIRTAEKRQRQLLSLTYAYKDGNGRLHLFIYNYGSETVKPERLYLAGTVYTEGSGGNSFSMKDAYGNPVSTIDPSQLVELTVPQPPGQPSFDVVLVTAEGGVFIWKFQG